jgi:hypothetical protein
MTDSNVNLFHLGETPEKEKACDSMMVQALSRQCMKNYFLINLYCCRFPFD